MSSFLNDPEAQRRYEERFGPTAPASDAPLFDDPAAQAAYEREGFRETPSLRRVDPQTTWHEQIRASRAAGPSSSIESATDGVEFAERSSLGLRLSARLRERGPASTQGDSTSGGSF